MIRLIPIFLLVLVMVACDSNKSEKEEVTHTKPYYHNWETYKNDIYAIRFDNQQWLFDLDTSLGRVTYLHTFNRDSTLQMAMMIKEFMHPKIISNQKFNLLQEALKVNKNMKFLNGYQHKDINNVKINGMDAINISFTVTGDDGLPLEINEFYVADNNTFLLVQSSGSADFNPRRDSVINTLRIF